MTTKNLKPHNVDGHNGNRIFRTIRDATFGLLLFSAVGCYEVSAIETDSDTNTQSDTDQIRTADNTTDNTADSDNPGTVGPPNYCLAFDGDGDYVRISNDELLNLPSQWTIEAWVRIDENATGLLPIFRKGDGNTHVSSYFLYARYDSGNVLGGYGYDVTGFIGLDNDKALEPQKWIHLAVTHIKKITRLYVDGVLVNENNDGRDARTIPDDVIIGATLHPTKTDFHKGCIDEVRISSIDRYIDGNIEEFTPQTRFELDEFTLALWHFDEGSGNLVEDEQNRFEAEMIGDVHFQKR